jgi:hypothetical protein
VVHSAELLLASRKQIPFPYRRLRRSVRFGNER